MQSLSLMELQEMLPTSQRGQEGAIPRQNGMANGLMLIPMSQRSCPGMRMRWEGRILPEGMSWCSPTRISTSLGLEFTPLG